MLIELPGNAAEFGRLLRCPYCSSIWLAAGFTWLDAHHGDWIVNVAAAAGLVQVFLDLSNWITGAAFAQLPAARAGETGGDPANAAD